MQIRGGSLEMRQTTVETHTLTPKYMTLYDLEILNGHFTLNFRYYEPRFSN